jgi:hypothetical protein
MARLANKLTRGDSLIGHKFGDSGVVRRECPRAIPAATTPRQRNSSGVRAELDAILTKSKHFWSLALVIDAIIASTSTQAC